MFLTRILRLNESFLNMKLVSTQSNIPKDRLKRKQQKRYLKNEIKFSDSTLRENLNTCNQYKLALELNHDHFAEGIRIRTKSTKFFLNLEKQHW